MTLDKIKAAVQEVAQQYPISRVTLFGSQANGTATEHSDIDPMIEFDRPITLITLSMVSQQLEAILHTSVDVIHGPVRSTDMFRIGKEIEIYAA